MRRGLLAGAAAALIVCFALPAWSQSTGGSFGGGSFGGSGSSGSSSSSSSSSSSGSSWGSGSSSYRSSSGSDYSSSSGGDIGAGLGLLFFAGLVVLGLVALAGRTGPSSGSSLPAGSSSDDDPGPLPASEMHTSILRLGIDWKARADLQAALTRMAASGDTATAAGRARLLGETTLALRRVEASWLYAGYKDLGWMSPFDAESAFRAAGRDARARFQRELIRNADGRVTEEAAPAIASRSDEGPGLVVVTVIAVARRYAQAVSKLGDASAIRRALDDRGALRADQLVALEVVWSPAAEADRMSSAELEQHYPELERIDPNSIAGRVACEYCRGLFAMELLTCPHCGGAVKAPPVES